MAGLVNDRVEQSAATTYLAECLRGTDRWLPDKSRATVIKNWGLCKDLFDVCVFLGTIGVVQIFIRNFAKCANALVQLNRKDVPFKFGEVQLAVMNNLCRALLKSPVLHAINNQL